jgi:hypothetical protein
MDISLKPYGTEMLGCVEFFWQKEPLELKGLKALDVNVARMINRLLVKDPIERLTVHKVLSSSFFKVMDNTTRRATSAEELSQVVRGTAGNEHPSVIVHVLEAVVVSNICGCWTSVVEWQASLTRLLN